MRVSNEKKQAVKHDILEKIMQGDPELTRTVAETFAINRATVYTYLNELQEQGIVRKVKRGNYELVPQTWQYVLERKKGDLDADMYAYHQCLEEHIRDLENNVIGIWSYVFSEMVNNVVDHSEAQYAYVFVERNYLKTRVLLYDDGVGIFRKIQDYFHLPSLEEAICELFKGKLTTDAENHSGEGIFFSSKLMDTFFIVSDGKIFTNNKYDESRIMAIAEDGADIVREKNAYDGLSGGSRAFLKGTCVIMELANSSRKNAKDVFDLYADEDGGFVKTRIPLKNIFDASPVSRSQAKRICNRLELFREAVLDFEGIQWMGQGFAHQLFVVFANQHPEMKLIPLHMNEDVAKMYHHVNRT